MELYSSNKNYKLYHGNMLDMLEVIEPNTIDSIITDPPYELNFMGKGWDNSGIAFQKETWQKCYEVLKPGGYLLAFGGSRTFHRIACAIGDAGFEIRDTIMWLYGSGFPKSMDISKQIDKKGGNDYSKQFAIDLKQARESRNLTMKYCDDKYCNGSTNWSWYEGRKDGCRVPDYQTYLEIIKEFPELEKYRELIKEAEREVIGKKESGCFNNQEKDRYTIGSSKSLEVDITIPNTDLAKQWNGWGTALKPSFEPIIVARKPFKGSLVDNVIEYGVGGINIDECRVPHNEECKIMKKQNEINSIIQQSGRYEDTLELKPNGRFPANTILTYDETDFDEVCGGFPDTKSDIRKPSGGKILNPESGWNNNSMIDKTTRGFNDSGSASRYFYCAKASKKDRDEGIKEYYKIIISKEDFKCEENMAQVQLLKKVIYDLEVENLNILEYGKNIMVIFPKECKSIILTGINKITELKTWNLLIHSLIKDYTVVVNCEKENGGNRVENVDNLKELKQIITSENQELVRGVSSVVYQMLLKIKKEENWQEANNFHCTVKPTELMQYLIRLVSPNGATILDPFNGSGSTGKAVMYENKERNKNYKYIGIELTEEYLPISKARIEYVCGKEKEVDDNQTTIFDFI